MATDPVYERRCGIVGFHLTEEDGRLLLTRARLAAAAALGGPKLDSMRPTSATLLGPGGCFVTFKRKDIKEAGRNLRGCLGCLEATPPLWNTVERMAADSVTKDYRFEHNPVTLEELPQLHIDISVIAPKRRLEDPLSFELYADGIEVHGVGANAGCRGIYLPQVAAEFKLDKEGFLNSCCYHKAGMPADAWKNPEQCQVYAFRAVVIAEAED